jgi:rRNA maturation RNase YbeY
MATVDIRTTTRGSLPRLPYREMAAAVLPTSYHLSLVICGDTLARTINTKYRKKTYAPNVLSFELDKNEGEIFLNVRKAEREARHMRTSHRARLALLFVHGLFHLRGMDHSDTMEHAEQKVLHRFKLAK